MFLQHTMVSAMFERVYTEERLELEHVAMLFLVTYTSLLRLQSKALPIVRGSAGVANNEQSCLYLSGDLLCLKFTKEEQATWELTQEGLLVPLL